MPEVGFNYCQMAWIEWFTAKVGLHRVDGRSFHLRDRAWMVYPPLED